jgi:hypothetical protein
MNGMKQLRYGDRTWLVGDSLASTMMDFAAALAKIDAAEHVRFKAIDQSGDVVEIEVLLGPATMMVAEPVHVTADEPENSDVEQTMKDRIEMISSVGADSGVG